eukprot:12350119-Ditylum_brightwellii.AAC.1
MGRCGWWTEGRNGWDRCSEFPQNAEHVELVCLFHHLDCFVINCKDCPGKLGAIFMQFDAE